MKKQVCLIALLPLIQTGFGQKLQIDFQFNGNIAFPTINDETYVRPLPVDLNSAYTAYYLIPADVDRQTVARPGLEMGVGLKWKPENKWHFNTGFRLNLIRYRIEPEYSIPDVGPYADMIDSTYGSLHSNPFGTLYGVDVSRPNPSPGVAGQISDPGVNAALVYGSVPLLVEYRLNRLLSLNAGMELSALLSARQSYYTLQWQYPAATATEKRITDTDKSGFSNFQTNLRAGVDCRLTESIALEVSFSHGLMNVYNNKDETDKNGAFKSRMRAVSLGFTYRVRNR
ncbi:MAG: outer membrane beta-barrel protein [Thermoanaerobaculia bacterium]|nr:outer membrane beta-barrel protein [Thermoanaerobaculia bacterium]